jgi:hypothetical protein
MKVLFVVSLIITAGFISGCISPPESLIRTSNGNLFYADDSGFQSAIIDVSSGGTVFLPPVEIPIDIMFYVNQDNLNIIGSTWGSQRTTLNFTNHTVWYDPSYIKGWRAVPPGTTDPAPRTADFSMKSMEFYHCKNLYMKDIVFTGAANIRFNLEEHSNLHLVNVDFIDIDRPFTHHTDYGSWASGCALEADHGTTLVSDVLLENCDIRRSTNWGFGAMAHEFSAATTFENFTFRNCTAFRCGMPVNGVPIIEYYDNGVKENNNWQNWSVGFDLAEGYYSVPLPTSKDFTFDNCTSEENRESGFHSEYLIIKAGTISYINCKSNRNGQKWLSQGYTYGYLPDIETYCSGFLGLPDHRYNVVMINCQADDNFLYGYLGTDRIYSQQTGCTATGNGIKNYY